MFKKSGLLSLACVVLCMGIAVGQSTKTSSGLIPVPGRLKAADASLNPASAVLLSDDRLTAKQGISLKKGVGQATEGEREEPDLNFKITVPETKLYTLKTYVVTDEVGAELMKKAKTKFESLFMVMQIGDKRGTKRVVAVPWDVPLQETGIFELEAGGQEVKIWLPTGVKFDYLDILPYHAPEIPAEAKNYKPKYLPPASHPRLWVSKNSLPEIKANLKKDEHIGVWNKLRNEALAPYNLDVDTTKELTYSEEIEKIAEKKAFYYLMTGDRKTGREALEVMLKYIKNVEFGNILDITRELGRAIYTASLVYDWTYDLLSDPEKETFRENLMRLARDMEIGWPPFRMDVVNGHGNEAIVNRDLLAMSIALYNEDPVPYQYVSYALLEHLVPMRKFEYQSPRHNQGVAYGAYRFAWEMHAASLFNKMLDKKVFDDNIMNVAKFFLYMRAPDGQMLRDGDGFGAGKPGEPYYWKNPLTMFMMYTYSADPVIKGEYLRHGDIKESNPVLFLLLNKPDLKAQADLSALPLTLDFGPVLGGMIARTGWNVGPDSDDVVAEIKGGGYHFGNHQHADAGSVQLFYRGFQFGDLGIYRFYGTPYDMGFNKRSVAHSMMLAYDPEEKFSRSQVNDGGTRLNQITPKTPDQVINDKWFHNGHVLSSAFGPEKNKPFYSYFSVNLTSAYTEKVKDYTRSFCFLNLGRPHIPAMIVMKDEMSVSGPGIQKYWQINAHHSPVVNDSGFLLTNNLMGRTGKTDVQIFPRRELNIEVFGGPDATNVFGSQLEAPETDYPEGEGHRIMVSSKNSPLQEKFVSVFQVLEGSAKPEKVTYLDTEAAELVYLGEEILVIMGKAGVGQPIKFGITSRKSSRVVLTGLKSGKWILYRGKKEKISEILVEEGEKAAYMEIPKGNFRLVNVPPVTH